MRPCHPASLLVRPGLVTEAASGTERQIVPLLLNSSPATVSATDSPLTGSGPVQWPRRHPGPLILGSTHWHSEARRRVAAATVAPPGPLASRAVTCPLAVTVAVTVGGGPVDHWPGATDLAGHWPGQPAAGGAVTALARRRTTGPATGRQWQRPAMAGHCQWH